MLFGARNVGLAFGSAPLKPKLICDNLLPVAHLMAFFQESPGLESSRALSFLNDLQKQNRFSGFP
jgi:hypothetical protein